ncbi:hypothetical protein BY996DRAFT_4584092 [Phakopsora pachyrhizi]|uniref:RRM domain-containing protein n=1 Tax=Phakopsora pachyrhizi TaxID=170000 RepID=A0AAV0ARI8_PHAPC|nr:hypothetical protein BY996DRAFT_4584092 [Phakopsora pachyrhizi]CAH7671020.1 hypothetical protein PPACK8108_LOCUS5770 [Phakopsora pachyrhizi]
MNSTRSINKPSNQPNATLYVQNLDDKIKKSDLQRLLYQLFLSYGKVIDVVVKKSKMRGQAFIVFSDLQGSTQAMRYLDGTSFLGKNLKITYGLTRSYATIRQLAGDEILYQVRLGLKDPQTLKDIDPKYSSNKLTVSGAQASNIQKRKAEESSNLTGKRARGDEEGGDDHSSHESSDNDDEDQENSNDRDLNKKAKSNRQNEDEDVEEAMEEDSDDENQVDSAAAAAVKAAGSAPVLSGEDPNAVLFLEGLPAEITDDMIAVLFQQYPGFLSVRLVPGRTGIGFVQFDNSTQSSMAKTALDGFILAPGIIMKVGFASKS